MQGLRRSAATGGRRGGGGGRCGGRGRGGAVQDFLCRVQFGRWTPVSLRGKIRLVLAPSSIYHFHSRSSGSRSRSGRRRTRKTRKESNEEQAGKKQLFPAGTCDE